ncbi:MAG: sulfate adenylyltransferase subunit CysD [Actinobacteria bacterium]|nr:sulfate adenylyltransferase subunit CysD [Actinomycetota bacterium]
MSKVEMILKNLENEAIEILRETASTFRNPVMMYSIGKDSSVLLHLAKKAFYPGPIPFPLLHIDTTWKFKEMISFRDKVIKKENLKLIVHTNATAVAEGINPFTSGISNYTRIMKTMALRQALDKYGFDAAIGGSRRDEEKSRAKERIFSVRGEGHSWNPRAQRPELWRSFNTSLGAGESMRVFPLSDWTEADIWLYILKEGIQINELYFAQEREMIERNGQWIMVNDNRFPLLNGEEPQKRKVRFRTLGCYPLTASVDSTATTVEEIVEEVLKVKLSERATRLIDGLDEDSMEKKKSEGYF